VDLLCPAAQEHRRLETQEPVRWPPQDGQPALTKQPRPDDGQRHDGCSAAKDDSWADALAAALAFLTLKHSQPCNVDVFSDRGLTLALSGRPQAGPLEGRVSHLRTTRTSVKRAHAAEFGTSMHEDGPNHSVVSEQGFQNRARSCLPLRTRRPSPGHQAGGLVRWRSKRSDGRRRVERRHGQMR